MTEAQWLACEDPEALLARAEQNGRTSQRVFRLFCAAFWGWHERHWKDNRVMGAANRELLRERVEKLEQWVETGVPPKFLERNVSFFNARARVAASDTARLGREWLPLEWGGPEVPVVICSLIRDVFGNPFRRVKVNRVWLTSTVVALARQMYESRDFGTMPILADALQDAGCTNDDILSHCRDAHATHVRGCWVLDLVLGKS
jgi:hypothetical protein